MDYWQKTNYLKTANIKNNQVDIAKIKNRQFIYSNDGL